MWEGQLQDVPGQEGGVRPFREREEHVTTPEIPAGLGKRAPRTRGTLLRVHLRTSSTDTGVPIIWAATQPPFLEGIPHLLPKL